MKRQITIILLHPIQKFLYMQSNVVDNTRYDEQLWVTLI